MKIGCVYTVDSYFEVDRPFSAATEIPFGLSIIITVLEQQGHNIELFVITPETDLDTTISKFISDHNPKLFCSESPAFMPVKAKRESSLSSRTNPTL